MSSYIHCFFFSKLKWLVVQLVAWYCPSVVQASISVKYFVHISIMKYIQLVQCSPSVSLCAYSTTQAVEVTMHQLHQIPRLHLGTGLGNDSQNIGWKWCKTLKSSRQKMAAYGGGNFIIATGITNFSKNNTNIKIIVISNHFKMLTINLKHFGKLPLLNKSL